MNTLQQNEQWFASRVGVITASRVGAILGLSPFATKEDVLREMVREHHGAEREFQGNVATEYGNEHESIAKAQYERDTGRFVVNESFCVHKELPWLGASPDGLVDDGLLEIKCPFGKKIKPLKDNPHYMAQVQIQMECLDRNWCDFYTWTPEEMDLESVSRDRDWFASVKDELKAFYNLYLSELDNPAHLEPIEQDMSESEEWARAETAYLEALERESAAKADKDIFKKTLVELANKRKAKGSRLQLFPVTKQGSISYAKALKEIAPGADLEPFRGKPLTSFTIKQVTA